MVAIDMLSGTQTLYHNGRDTVHELHTSPHDKLLDVVCTCFWYNTCACIAAVNDHLQNVTNFEPAGIFC